MQEHRQMIETKKEELNLQMCVFLAVKLRYTEKYFRSEEFGIPVLGKIFLFNEHALFIILSPLFILSNYIAEFSFSRKNTKVSESLLVKHSEEFYMKYINM